MEEETKEAERTGPVCLGRLRSNTLLALSTAMPEALGIFKCRFLGSAPYKPEADEPSTVAAVMAALTGLHAAIKVCTWCACNL